MAIVKKIQIAYYHQILLELLLMMVVLTYVIKNVNLSNNSRVSKSQSFSGQYVLNGSIQNTFT